MLLECWNLISAKEMFKLRNIFIFLMYEIVVYVYSFVSVC